MVNVYDFDEYLYNKLILESITLQFHEYIGSKLQSWDHDSKMKEDKFSPPPGFELRSSGASVLTNKLG